MNAMDISWQGRKGRVTGEREGGRERLLWPNYVGEKVRVSSEEGEHCLKTLFYGQKF